MTEVEKLRVLLIDMDCVGLGVSVGFGNPSAEELARELRECLERLANGDFDEVTFDDD